MRLNVRSKEGELSAYNYYNYPAPLPPRAYMRGVVWRGEEWCGVLYHEQDQIHVFTPQLRAQPATNSIKRIKTKDNYFDKIVVATPLRVGRLGKYKIVHPSTMTRPQARSMRAPYLAF